MAAGLQLYNTHARRVEEFEPLDPQRVSMYVCGPTVYNLIHIGNARPAVVFDVLYRILKLEYPEVVYARNITDIDDKIMKAAAENGEEIADLAARYAAEYDDDMQALGNLEPNIKPYATQHIQDMISLIENIIDAGHGYAAEGHALFDVTSMDDYGSLSNRTLEDMLDGARVEVAPYKKNPGDFVLWKPSTDDEPGWDSPWGRGRPGWHIECSAMIKAHLGETIDIHGGGRDLIFPHHENERAQSQCAHGGKEFVRYWMHNGYINIGGEKMSKSLGNFHTVRDLRSHYKGEVIRYALLKAHYRSELDFSADQLDEAKASLDSLYGALRRAKSVETSDISDSDIKASVFYQALLEDVGTPQALSELHSLAGQLNTSEKQRKTLIKAQLKACGGVLGLLTQDADDWFQEESTLSTNQEIASADIDTLVAARHQAKLDKDYARADEIRAELLEKGIVLEDSRDGTEWRRA